MNFKICASILLVIGGVSYCSGEEDYEHITDSKECDGIAPIYEWQNMAKGINAKSTELSTFHIFDTSLRNKDGSCYVFKTGTNRYRLPGYIHHVTKEWTHTSGNTTLYRSWAQNHIDKNSIHPKADGSNNIKLYWAWNYERRNKLLSYASELGTKLITNVFWQLVTFTLTKHRLPDVPLDTEFVDRVKKLPVTFGDENDEQYKLLADFLASYGHMFPKKVKLGGLHLVDFYFGNCAMTSLQLEKTVDEIISLVDGAYVARAGRVDVRSANERIQYLTKTSQMSRKACKLKGGTGATCPITNIEREIEFVNSITKHPALVEGDYLPIDTILDHPDFVNLANRSDIQKALRRFIKNDLKSKEAPSFFRCIMKNRECRCELQNVASISSSNGCCPQPPSANGNISTDIRYLGFLIILLIPFLIGLIVYIFRKKKNAGDNLTSSNADNEVSKSTDNKDGAEAGFKYSIMKNSNQDASRNNSVVSKETTDNSEPGSHSTMIRNSTYA